MPPSTISAINLLSEPEKRQIYSRVVPQALLQHFNLPALDTSRGSALLQFKATPGTSDVEMRLYHEARFPDPILYGHLTDTLTGQIHVLLYILNDPDSPRYNVDFMPDGSSTRFGTFQRNLQAEEEALRASLAPGQVRHGLRMLSGAIETFEQFVASLGHDIYFVEPLYYHNAIIFERYGFTYQQGKRLMERIETGFGAAGDLTARLDNSSPFRAPAAARSIRLRSWAIHDGILGEPFTNVTMYKRISQNAGVSTCPGCAW